MANARWYEHGLQLTRQPLPRVHDISPSDVRPNSSAITNPRLAGMRVADLLAPWQRRVVYCSVLGICQWPTLLGDVAIEWLVGKGVPKTGPEDAWLGEVKGVRWVKGPAEAWMQVIVTLAHFWGGGGWSDSSWWSASLAST